MKKTLFSLLALFLLAESCTKTPPDPTHGTMLRTGKWKISAATIRMKLPNGKDTTMDYIQFIPKCHQDDYIRFDSLSYGSVHNNGTSCSVADADSISFVWRLKNNETVMDIFNGFTLIDSVAETILTPYHFDTLSQDPFLVLDTISNDPANIVLDTVWDLNFSSATTSNINIYNATLSNFTQASFTMDFILPAHYPDSTHFHEMSPIIRPDSFHYHVTYSNF